MQETQIILVDETLRIIEPNITFTAVQYAALQDQIWDGMIVFGILAIMIGFCIGAYVGWSWKTYYQNKQDREEEEEDQNWTHEGDGE